jgi:hypothetical protein
VRWARYRFENGSADISNDPFLDVVGALARSELDDAKVGEAPRMKGIFLDDGLDLLPTRAYRQDDSTIAWDLSARDEEIARRVVLLQELDVRDHVRVDFREADFIGQFNDKHRSPSLHQTRRGVKKPFGVLAMTSHLFTRKIRGIDFDEVLEALRHAPLVSLGLPIELLAIQPPERLPGIRGDGVGFGHQRGKLLIHNILCRPPL